MKKPDEILQEFKNKLATIPDKQKQVIEILEFTNIYGDSYGIKIVSLLDDAIRTSKEIGFEAGEIICYFNLVFFKTMTDGKIKSKYEKLMPTMEELMASLKKYPEWHSFGLCMWAYLHWFKGEYDKGFNMAFEALKTAKNSPIQGEAWANFALAVFHFDTKDLENSASYYQKACDQFKQGKHEYGIARASNGLASIAILKNKTDEAASLLDLSIGVYRNLGQHAGLSRALNDKGALEKANGNYGKAISFFNESIELRKEINHVQGQITSYTELGEAYLLLKDHAKALEQFKTALDLAQDISAFQKQMRLSKFLYETYKELDNTELALKYFENYFELRSKILSDEASNNIKRIQTKYETERSEKEAEIERLKNIELKKANAIIEQKNKDITDSINYAKRIQLGILPPNDILEKCFENYFVLYKPKDIVSGDFYWAVASTNKQKEKVSIIAAVDCTGHGVPGAFMSMLGNTLLNQTILNHEIESAASILNYLNTKLPENLKSTGQDHNLRDGMDMGLCIFDFKNKKLQFSGANNPCWIIRNKQLIEIKGDKQAISASNDTEKKNFTDHHVDLQKNDCVYLLTDGYADQFGGPNEKKFTYKRLKEALLENSDQPLSKQKETLEQIFENWRNGLEQIDDVCLIGIKI